MAEPTVQDFLNLGLGSDTSYKLWAKGCTAEEIKPLIQIAFSMGYNPLYIIEVVLSYTRPTFLIDNLEITDMGKRTAQIKSIQTSNDTIISVAEEFDSEGRHSCFSISVAGPDDMNFTTRMLSKDELVALSDNINDFLLSDENKKLVLKDPHNPNLYSIPAGLYTAEELLVELEADSLKYLLQKEEEYKKYRIPQSFRERLTVPVEWLTRWIGEHSPSTLVGLRLYFSADEQYEIDYVHLGAARPFFQLKRLDPPKID